MFFYISEIVKDITRQDSSNGKLLLGMPPGMKHVRPHQFDFYVLRSVADFTNTNNLFLQISDYLSSHHHFFFFLFLENTLPTPGLQFILGKNFQGDLSGFPGNFPKFCQETILFGQFRKLNLQNNHKSF